MGYHAQQFFQKQHKTAATAGSGGGGGGGCGGSTPLNPPKSTTKAIEQQRYRAEQLRKRRAQEEAHRAELAAYASGTNGLGGVGGVPSEDTKRRVRESFAFQNLQCLGSKEFLEMDQERRTYEKRMASLKSEKRWAREVALMEARVQNRPLLMERL